MGIYCGHDRRQGPVPNTRREGTHRQGLQSRHGRVVSLHHAHMVPESMHALLLPQAYVGDAAPFVVESLYGLTTGRHWPCRLETRQRRLVIIAAVACVFSYMATIGVVLLRCLPFHKNWQIYPYPGGKTNFPV